jgi:hypothetical protein
MADHATRRRALWIIGRACGKTWGRAQEKLCASRNIMHRNLRLPQQKCLSRRAISPIIWPWLARAPVHPIGNRRPIWRWVGGKMIGRIGAQLAFGRVLRVMRPALHGDGSIKAGALSPRSDLTATPASLRDSRHGAGSGGCVLRGASRGSVIGGAQGVRAGRCPSQGPRRRKAVSRPDAAGGGREPTRSSSQGAGSGSFEGRRTAREGVPTPLALLRAAQSWRQRRRR